MAVEFTPRAVPRESDRIRDAFLSATAKDARDFRLGVGEALRPLNVAVFLQEYWAAPYQNVVTLCLNRLADSDAYLGVFGFRYGWIPDGFAQSITELEYEKALDLWGQKTLPPIFVFLPEPGKEAAKQLEAAAIEELAREYAAVADRGESRRLQKTFCDRIRGNNKFVRSFETLAMLREQALAAVAIWNEEILREVLSSRPPAAVQGIPFAELGSIGRDDLFDDIDDAYGAAVDAKAAGVCFVIHGPEDAGHVEFHAWLEARNPWEISRPVRLITPAHDRFDVTTLIAATLAATAPDLVPPASTIDVLAAALLERCRTEPVVMFLAIARLTGGLDVFRDDFWAPLVRSAQTQAVAGMPAHPFIIVLDLGFEMVQPLPPAVVATPLGKGWNPTSVVLTPALGALTEKDVESWLRDHEMKRADSQVVAARVIGDGRPRGVFDRLNSDGVWTRLAQTK